MKRAALLALILVGAVSCQDSPTSPSDPNVATFTAILLPSNEVPALAPTNLDAPASGTMQMKMTVTRDAAGVITGATYDFTVSLTGFQANTTLTGAHIHNAPAGTNAPIVVNMALAATDTSVPTGQTSITKTGLTAQNAANAAAVTQSIFNTPANNYFNVHTTVNTPGAIRGQLVRMN